MKTKLMIFVVLGLVLLASSVFAAKSIIFLHHSVGDDLITRGDVRQSFTSLGYDFYDHGYNDAGLRLANGDYANRNFAVPDDNTEPSGYAAIFSQSLTSPPSNTLSYLMQYDVIIFKSCFSASGALASDEQLAEYKADYITIRNSMRQFPDKVFIVLSPPPNVPSDTSPETAARARAFANWLKTSEFTDNLPNLFVFDLFDAFAGSDNMLKSSYRQSEYDSHPNEAADRAVAPLFVSFVDQSIRNARTSPRNTSGQTSGQTSSSQTSTQSSQTQAQSSPSTTTTSQSSQLSSNQSSNIITDFETETSAGEWRASHGEHDSAECTPTTTSARGGGDGKSLRFQYTLGEDGWAHCGHAFATVQNFQGTAGISFWMRTNLSTEQLNQVIVNIFTGDHENPTDYEASIQLAADSGQASDSEGSSGWKQIRILWSEFSLAPSAEGSTTAAAVDTSHIQRIGFTATGAGNGGVLWIDDISTFRDTSAPDGSDTSTGAGTSEQGTQNTQASGTGTTGTAGQANQNQLQSGASQGSQQAQPGTQTKSGGLDGLWLYAIIGVVVVVGGGLLIVPRLVKKQ